MERKRLLAALVGLLLLIAVASCGGDDDGGDEVEQQRFDLVIGDLAPMSGELAEFGLAGEKATGLALDRINSAISESGADVSVEIVRGDSGGGPAAAAQTAMRMVDADGASCLVGGWTPEDTLEVATSVAIAEEVLQISPVPPDEEVAVLQDDELVNSLGPAPDVNGAATATIADNISPPSAFDELYDDSEPTGVEPAPYAAEAFDATILCYLAAVAAGSAEGKEMALWLIDNTAPTGTEYGWQDLPDAVEALEAGEDIDYMGASGPIDMDENGNATPNATAADSNSAD